MKTQLLEDIGENAGLAPPGEEVHSPAPATEPGEPPVAADLHSVFEEIAALEAQFVPPVTPVTPVQQQEAHSAPAQAASAPPAAPLEPLNSLALGPASRLLQPAGRASEPPAQPLPAHAAPLPQPAYPPDDLAFIPDWVQRPTALRDPLFDFTVPAQGYAAAEPFTRPPAGLTRSGRRYILGGGCVLSAVLLVMGGRWLYQERADTAALAFIANNAPQEDKAVKASTQGPAAKVPASAAVESRPASLLPPLVMLEPDPPGVATPAAAKPEPLPPAAPQEPRVEPPGRATPGTVARPKPASSLPERSNRTPRKQAGIAAAPIEEKSQRERVRPAVRASTILAESRAQPDTSMTATLKACREHGYGATQCVKRGCSLTRYGFACRGR